MDQFLTLIVNLTLAHLLADFYCQTESSCRSKLLKNHKSIALWVHFFIMLFALWIGTMSWKGILLAVPIAAVHLIVDWFKSFLSIRTHIFRIEKDNLVPGKNNQYDLLSFLVDQILHVVTIVGFVWLFRELFLSWSEPQYITAFYHNHPLWVATIIGVVVVAKPANILVLAILNAWKINVTSNDDHGQFRSGALIGNLERILILLFVVLSQYEAIGFLMTAKSILRFKETSEGEKSEYVLCGTLLSLTISLTIGLVIIKLISFSSL